MKNKNFAILFVITIIFVCPVFAHAQDRENPSLYSFGEIVKNLPQKWLAVPDDVMKMMEDYPDFECWRSYDIVGCQSVNNKYSAEIHVNYQFTSEEDDAELVRTVFTMPVNNTQDVQNVIENFWIDGMKAANISGAQYPTNQVTLYFSSENTLMTYNIDWGSNGVWLVLVDMGLIRG